MSVEANLRRAAPLRAPLHTPLQRIVQRMYTPCHREPDTAWQPPGFREPGVANGRRAKGPPAAPSNRVGLSTRARASACVTKPPVKKVHCRCNPRLGQLASPCLAPGGSSRAALVGPGGGGVAGGAVGARRPVCRRAIAQRRRGHAQPPRLTAPIRTGRCPKRGLAPALHSGSSAVAALPVGRH